MFVGPSDADPIPRPDTASPIFPAVFLGAWAR
jgi:hypothetical protein